MTARKIGLELVLVSFTVLTGIAIYEYGYIGFFAALFANSVGITVAVDLVISLTFVLVWLIGDARKNGMSPLPYVVLTLGFGSVGPLLYLLRRPEVRQAA